MSSYRRESSDKRYRQDQSAFPLMAVGYQADQSTGEMFVQQPTRYGSATTRNPRYDGNEGGHRSIKRAPSESMIMQMRKELDDVMTKQVTESISFPGGQTMSQRGSVTKASHVAFTESSSLPGVPILNRSPDEKINNPDRLNLDSFDLEVCPRIDGEPLLRLLNFQHNHIRKIENLYNFQSLIFLDFYDNAIEEISGLERLSNLRVLMLGKNQIKRIENLTYLSHLDVLDLHSNKLTKIENMAHLHHLRVLNLAGNAITEVAGIQGLVNLTELNLRRNKIRSWKIRAALPQLQRLFLSYNDIDKIADVESISNLELTELALDGNAVCKEHLYREFWVTKIPSLRTFDGRRVSDEERRMGGINIRREEDKRREEARAQQLRHKRSQILLAMKQNWNKAASPSPVVSPKRDPKARRPVSAAIVQNSAAKQRSRVASAGPLGRTDHSEELIDNWVEESGDTLYLYGNVGSGVLDKNFPNVTKIVFQYVDFQLLPPIFGKLRQRAPQANSLSFKNTNLRTIQQVNFLAVVKKLEHLVFDETEPILHCLLWRRYVIHRLAHLPLKTINGEPVTLMEQKDAEKAFSPFSQLMSKCVRADLLALGNANLPSQIPPAQDTKRKTQRRVVETDNRSNPKRDGTRLRRTPSRTEVSRGSRAANDIGSVQSAKEIKADVLKYLSSILDHANSVNRTRQELDREWSGIVEEIVRKSFTELASDTVTS